MGQVLKFKHKRTSSRVVMAHAFSPSIQETEVGGSLWLQDHQPGLLQSKFQGSQGYTERSCLKKNKIK